MRSQEVWALFLSGSFTCLLLHVLECQRKGPGDTISKSYPTRVSGKTICSKTSGSHQNSSYQIPFLFSFSLEIQLIYNVVFASSIQQSDLVIHTYTYICMEKNLKKNTYIYMYILFQILFHSRLPQDIGYSSLRYTVGPCCSSILYIVHLC